MIRSPICHFHSWYKLRQYKTWLSNRSDGEPPPEVPLTVEWKCRICGEIKTTQED